MSYITAIEAQTLLDSFGQNQFTADTAVLNQCLFRASKWIDNKYGQLYPGITLTSDQELLWPRTSCVDLNGQVIQQGTTPKQIKYATAIIAQAFLLGEIFSESNQIKRDKTVVGAITTEVEYFSASSIAKSQTIVEVESWLASLIGETSKGKIHKVTI